jgi:hypothetical protein
VTPAAVLTLIIGGLRMASVALPPRTRVMAGRIFDALDEIPPMIDALGDGEWDDDDVESIAVAARDLLEQVEGVSVPHARRIGNGVAAAVDLIRASLVGSRPALRAKDRLRRARASAVAQRLPDVVKP